MNRYFVTCDGLETRVTEWGDVDKPVIFCLHGLGSTALSFIEIAEALKSEYRIIAIDAPGHGKTEPFDNEASYEFPQLCSWLNRLFDRINVEEFYFLSHSWGSFVALYYLLDNSNRVKGSLLIDGGYQSKLLRGTSADDEAAFYEVDFEGYCETWTEFLDVAVYDGGLRRSELLDLAAHDLTLVRNDRYYWHARGKTGGAIIKAMHKHEILEFLERIPTQQIILLRATLPLTDEEFKINASSLFQEKTGAIVKSIPSAPHMLHWHDPDVVIREIRDNWQ